MVLLNPFLTFPFWNLSTPIWWICSKSKLCKCVYHNFDCEKEKIETHSILLIFKCTMIWLGEDTLRHLIGDLVRKENALKQDLKLRWFYLQSWLLGIFLILEAMHKYDVRCNSERGNIALQLLVITRGRTDCIYLVAPVRFYYQHRKNYLLHHCYDQRYIWKGNMTKGCRKCNLWLTSNYLICLRDWYIFPEHLHFLWTIRFSLHWNR